MSLGDCPKCWDHTCSCGYSYNSLDTKTLKKIEEQTKIILRSRKENKKLKWTKLGWDMYE